MLAARNDAPGVRDEQAAFLLDVTRLIWRAWKRRHATGIDRVCLAYLERFAGRSWLVIRRRGFGLFIRPRDSQLLIEVLRKGRPGRAALIVGLARALLGARRSPPRKAMIYLNVGHTGLDDSTLADWVGRNRVRPIYLIHDLIPLTNPEYTRPGEASKHSRRMINTLRTAEGIVGNSAVTLHDLENFARSQKIRMPAATAAWISGQYNRESVEAPPLDHPYFVTVGTIEARKNHLLLLKIWDQLVAQLGDEAPMLMIIGQRGWEAEEAFERLDQLGNLAEHVLEIRSCGDKELSGWIAGARALLMPSFVEGFGLPVIEAFDLGTPVIASDLPVYHEIVGEIPTYLDPSDVVAWASAVSAFMTDGPDRKRQLARLQKYIAPTWSDHFSAVEPWLARL